MPECRNPADYDYREIIKSRLRQLQRRIGILKDESEACEGADIENMSDEDLKDFVGESRSTQESLRSIRSGLSVRGRKRKILWQ